uniref:Uncharacterized protein n=1 Tax=viral metagenome TaxID=1070528 RepID=A0A6C0KWG9_9ZZZZ
MFIKDSEKSEILQNFPNIELSYETVVHKKVYDFDYVVAIPEGNKFFAWFTIFRNQYVCMILEITDNKQINDIEIVPSCFKDSLCYGVGTIFYGTIFNKNSTRFFTVEDIFYSSGKNVNGKGSLNKFYFLEIIFKNELKQIAYFENSMVFGLPLMKSNFESIVKEVDFLHYKIKTLNFIKSGRNQIKVLLYNKSNNFSNYGNDIKREAVFKVKPDIQNDIYYLYTSDENLEGLAYISNYNSSVMMNKLFRNIKENNNLDALEESDEEDDFQNDSLDKFVFLDRVYNMLCKYNYKFKKWEPIRLANKDEKIVCKKELSYIEKIKSNIYEQVRPSTNIKSRNSLQKH